MIPEENIEEIEEREYHVDCKNTSRAKDVWFRMEANGHLSTCGVLFGGNTGFTVSTFTDRGIQALYNIADEAGATIRRTL